MQSEIFIESETRINAIDISQDSKYIAAGGQDGTIKIWNANDTTDVKIVNQESNNAVTALKFDNQGDKLVSGDARGSVKIWTTDNYKLIESIEVRKSRINDIDFNKSDQLMATALQDGTAKLWDFTNMNNQPVDLTDHESWVLSAKFSPDGKSLVTSSKDKDRIIIWPTNIDNMAKDLKELITRNMSQEEWEIYVAKDINYQKTVYELNN